MNDLPPLRLADSVDPSLRAMRLWCLLWLLPLLLVVGCGVKQDNPDEVQATGAVGIIEATRPAPTAPPPTPQLELVMIEDDVSIDPLPLRAGFPFTVTASVHNNSELLAVDIPLMVYVSARQEEIGYTSFLHLFTMTLPASQTVPLTVPVDWNFAGGEHQLWIQANRLPDAWYGLASVQPEADIANNIVLLDLMIDPFDAYTSDLCSGRVDVEIGPADVLPDPDRQHVLVRVHNLGNRAVYNLPVVITGDKMAGIAYTPAIPPCGGTAEVYVPVDRPLEEGEALTVRVNPDDWENALQEDNSENNQVSVAAGLAPGVVIPPGSGLEDYDFRLDTGDIETPEPWTVLVTVQNLGTRDAAMVPIQIENEAGRKIVDAIPLVQGEGIGTAAFRVGYLWIPGGTLTFTLNPQDANGAYPETNWDNNVATFVLP
ncbi:MAG TPA: hypothetical protein VLY63_28370 [Anaerolineae bacterium]|nr:hypothetical protein [Anaerolineae bacterium]